MRRAPGGKLFVPQTYLLDAKFVLEYCADCVDDVVGKFPAIVGQRNTRANALGREYRGLKLRR